MTPAVEITELFRVHQTAEGDAAALQGLSLTIREREVVTVLGPSGSGKSTLLRILAGLDRPSAGAVRVFGREIGKLPTRELGRYRTETVGYADQHYSRALSPELTARELVALELGLTGWTRLRRERRADELLERVGLADKRDSRPPELSGGEQQRIAVAASIAHRPRLFLADEPTGELDAASATLVYETIGDLVRAERCTAVIVSHDPESTAVADRIVRIRDGRVSEEIARAVDEDEAIVVGRGGWLRLPEDLLRRSGIRSHASARLDGRNIVVAAARAEEEEADVAPTALDPPADTEVVADLRAVRKLYGRGANRRAALDRIDAAFSSSLLTAVIGPSGSGKTTLLQVLAGLELPTSGDVLVLGTALTSLERAARARFRREHIGYVGQQAGLVATLTARENVELALALRAHPTDAAREVLVAVGLEDRIEQRVSRLSTGERGRVAIARALAPRPELLLADEPTSRLDQANALAIGTLFVSLARQFGTAVVCATHDPLLIEHADEILD
ncbi:MAG TPA: ATP-binding cassette domain-containing protein, partial [Gaiellaceae bacterium]|nr:ATP-binding cassette domain-containing protein [Gaiellaceae bacterium]